MSDPKPIAPFAARPVGTIACVVGVTQLIAALLGSNYRFDEVYMLAIGRHHLDWGSADQPPIAPAMPALLDTVFPGSLVALRIPSIIATSAAVAVAALIAREMGCDRRAQVLVAGAQATALWITLARGLPADRQRRTAIVGGSYIVAAYVDGYSQRYGLPRAFSVTRSYGYFDPPPEEQDSMLLIGSEPEQWEPYCAHSENVGRVEGLDAWLLTGRTQPWADLWARLQTLRVP